jgi:hypothetical protein
MASLHHTPIQAIWFLKTISSHKYEERRIEVYDKYSARKYIDNKVSEKIVIEINSLYHIMQF